MATYPEENEEREDRLDELLKPIDETYVSCILDNNEFHIVWPTRRSESLPHLFTHCFHRLWKIGVLLPNDAERVLDTHTYLTEQWTDIERLAPQRVATRFEPVKTDV
ncbi:unnamed protein product [Clonostachys chloroleuca]|uniref:Uncharacterized protein n=1 Tax=Clonostachys chloroleuca TaxID=1926264 RepID=A0AA35M085_9HYPO|nr:unnamed protein product [Clonostachys chloroleuca]